MNDLLYSNINNKFDYLNNNYNDLNNNIHEYYSNFNNNYNTLKSKNKKYIYNETILNEILLCNKSRNYIIKKILDTDIILKILFKIKNFEIETIITLLIGMVFILILNIILKYTNNILIN